MAAGDMLWALGRSFTAQHCEVTVVATAGCAGGRLSGGRNWLITGSTAALLAASKAWKGSGAGASGSDCLFGIALVQSRRRGQREGIQRREFFSLAGLVGGSRGWGGGLRIGKRRRQRGHFDGFNIRDGLRSGSKHDS